MSRYIDADTVFNELTSRYKTAKGEARKAYREALDIVTAVEEIEVRHGMWVVKHGVLAGDGIYGDMGECSVCGLHLRNYEWNYCPNCGSRMDLEGDAE